MRARSQSYPGATGCGPAAGIGGSTGMRRKSTSPGNGSGATRVPKFLRCLYDILYHEDSAILSWSSDGSNFQVYDIPRLEGEVLPKYFKHGKFASFQRQLNNFGFRKWTKTQSNVCTFSHHHFVQRHPDKLVELVIAQNEKSDHSSAASYKSKVEKLVSASQSTTHGKRKREATATTATTVAPVKMQRPTPLTAWLDTKDVDSVCFQNSNKSSFENNQIEDRKPIQSKSPLIAVPEQSFDLEIADTWGLMIDATPLPWNLAASKVGLGGETPTTVSAPIGNAFDFAFHDVGYRTTAGVEEHRIMDYHLLSELFTPDSLQEVDGNNHEDFTKNVWPTAPFGDKKATIESPEMTRWIN